MTLADIKDLIASVGFPIFVAVYFLVAGTKAIRMNTAAIEKLGSVVSDLKEIIGKLCDKLTDGK